MLKIMLGLTVVFQAIYCFTGHKKSQKVDMALETAMANSREDSESVRRLIFFADSCRAGIGKKAEDAAR